MEAWPGRRPVTGVAGAGLWPGWRAGGWQRRGGGVAGRLSYGGRLLSPPKRNG